jgi:hypothetical protein
MRKLISSIVMLTVVLGAGTALAWSPKLEVNEDVWMQVGFLGQVWFEAVEDNAGTNNDEWSKDFYFRRARILGQGSVHKYVKFFFDTDVPNSGKKGNTGDNDLILNDAFVDLQIMPEFKVAFGRILVPFSVENKASAALLLGIDYNTNVTKIPTFITDAFWRDDGIEVRGILLDGLIDYRVGLFTGEDDPSLNPDDNLRTTGMVMINLGDAQPGWFYNMNSLGSLRVLSFSAGYDYIGNGGAGVEDGKAWNVGANFEQPLGNGRIVGSAAYYDWDGPNFAGGFEGHTASVQAGYLMPCPFREGSFIQPVLRWQYQDPDGGSELNTFNIGLNYFLKGHNINFKVDYAINDRFIAGERVDAFRFQTQLLF